MIPEKEKRLRLKPETVLCRGIFTEYGITLDDCTQSIRNDSEIERIGEAAPCLTEM